MDTPGKLEFPLLLHKRNGYAHCREFDAGVGVFDWDEDRDGEIDGWWEAGVIFEIEILVQTSTPESFTSRDAMPIIGPVLDFSMFKYTKSSNMTMSLLDDSFLQTRVLVDVDCFFRKLIPNVKYSMLVR